MSLLRKRQTRAAGGYGGGSGIPQIFMGTDTQPVSVEHAKCTPIVTRCVNRISADIAAMPIDVFGRGRDGIARQVNTPAWLKQPSVDCTPIDFWMQALQSLLYYGNAYVYQAKNARGGIIDMKVLHPNRVEVQLTDSGRKVFRLTNGLEKELYLTSDELVHIKAFAGPEDLMGFSPIHNARYAIKMARLAQKFGADLYENNLNLTGVIELPGDVKPDVAKRVADEWVSRHKAGQTGGNAIGVLGGGAKFNTITMTPADAQFIEAQKWNTTEIANLFDLPAQLVDPSQGSWAGTGLEAMTTFYKQHTLSYWITLIEQSINTLLPGNQYMKFNVDAQLRGTPKERADVHRVGIGGATGPGYRTINEVRALENLAPIPGGDALYSPVFVQATADIAKQAELQQEKTLAETDKIQNDGGQTPGGTQ